MACDHGRDKRAVYLDFLPLGEVWMCECGVMYDLMHPDNYEEITHLLSADDLKEQVRGVEDNLRNKIRKSVERIFRVEHKTQP